MLVRTPKIIKWLFPKLIWNKLNSSNSIFLTFDDGPIPIVTEEVLKILETFQIKATFFCIGNNIQKHPEIFKRIIQEGHSIGNHTFNHLNGWKSSQNEYSDNILKTDQLIQDFVLDKSKFFRPPYGKISRSQIKDLLKNKFQIIMWTVLTQDYNKNITPEKCFQNSIKNIKSGDIILFHDSEKAKENMLYSLPKTIAYLKEKGFKFEPL